MSRATISTGNITFNQEGRQNNSTPEATGACHIALLADFSGRGYRGLNDVNSIKQRKIIAIDRDNFDEIFAQMNVQCSLPLVDEALSFNKMDDMHPDFIYDQVELFSRFRTLKRRLRSPTRFEETAQEIYQWHESKAVEKSAQKPNTNKNNMESSSAKNNISLLDNILSDTEVTSSSSSFNIQDLIKDIVGPYATPKSDPREKELLNAVDDATSELMRKIMHHPQFQNLESAWRSLYWLVRRIETNQKLKLFIVDVSQQELIEDALACDDVSQSNVYQLLVANRSSVGSTPFSVIMHDASFGHSVEDIRALGLLGATAASIGAIAVTAGTEKLAGCENLNKTPDKDDWNYSQTPEVNETWTALRSSPQASSIILAAPRYLCRMPYGKKSAPIESFNFEELPVKGQHPYYLWSSGAWLITLLVAQNYTIGGDRLATKVQEIDRLPLHVFIVDGESRVTPCAEVQMLDSAASALGEAGLTAIRSIANKDSVIIPSLRSIQE